MVAIFGDVLQQQLFPALEQELGPLSERMQEFVRVLALVGLDGFVALRRVRGRRRHDRSSIARAFLAKAIFNLPHTRALLERLAHDEVLRRLCGWDTVSEGTERDSVFAGIRGVCSNRVAATGQQALVRCAPKSIRRSAVPCRGTVEWDPISGARIVRYQTARPPGKRGREIFDPATTRGR